MKDDKNILKGRHPIDEKDKKSEIIRVRFTPKERAIIKRDCEKKHYEHLSTYLHDYYFTTRKGRRVIFSENSDDDLMNIASVISANSKVNDCLSLLKRNVNPSHSLTYEQSDELSQLLQQVTDDLHIIKARLMG